jgi:hypothetical protein
MRQATEVHPPSESVGTRPASPSRRPSGPTIAGRRAAIAGAVMLALIAGVWMLRGGETRSPVPEKVPGTPAWAQKHYGNSQEAGFERRKVVQIDFLGRSMFVHRAASRHFLRLERLFEARSPEYAAAVAAGELDDWSYFNRRVRGANVKSNHAFGLAVDINALANPVGTAGDMPQEVVRQWEAEGGEWGGDWNRPDPMHFETHLTPEQIRARYRADGTPRDWYLDQLRG